MRKIYFLVIAIVLVGVIVYSYYHPIVINYPSEIIQQSGSEKVYKKGDIITPFKDYDFDSGNYTAYVIIKDRRDLTEQISHAGVLKTKNISFLKGLQDIKFEYMEADVATIDNEFLLFDDDQLVFRSGIVTEERREGLQNPTFGWIWRMDPNKRMRDYIKDFHACFPIALLPK